MSVVIQLLAASVLIAVMLGLRMLIEHQRAKRVPGCNAQAVGCVRIECARRRAARANESGTN